MSMQPQRYIVAVIAALVLLVVLSGIWLLGRLTGSGSPPPHAGATPVATPTTVPSATLTPLRAPSGYRLAGVALGEPDSFVVIEAPNGTTALYRSNAEIPGLGTLVQIESEHVVVRGTGGDFELWLAPAATATPTAARRAPTPKPPPRSTRGGTAAGSTPSIVPGRPAS